MSVNYKASLMFGCKFSHKEAQEMLINCDYEYEDDFVPVDAWADPDKMEYIFGYEIITCGMGYCYSFTDNDFLNFISGSDVMRLVEKLNKMGYNSEEFNLPDFDFYVVGMVH